MSGRVAISMALGLVLLCATAGLALADDECFPPCRDGYDCQNGQCVPSASDSVCVPECRQGYECDAGACVAVAEPERQPKKKKPERPRSPPRFELVLFYALGDTLISEGLPDTSAPGEWEHFGSRELDFGARIKYRETKSGKAWLSLELGLSQLHYAKQTSTDHSCCISDGIVVAIEQVLRFPILGPQYAWQVDNRASIDISAGPYLLNAAEMDIGAQGAIRLSFYWLEIGPVASYGSKSGLGVGVESGLHVAF